MLDNNDCMAFRQQAVKLFQQRIGVVEMPSRSRLAENEERWVLRVHTVGKGGL